MRIFARPARGVIAAVAIAVATAASFFLYASAHWPAGAPLIGGAKARAGLAGALDERQLIDKAVRDERHRQLMETLEQRGRAADAAAEAARKAR